MHTATAVNRLEATRAARTSAVAAALRRWLDRARLDERTRYLSDAIDCADLERRVAAWERHAAAAAIRVRR